jgi:hypothetical protein
MRFICPKAATSTAHASSSVTLPPTSAPGASSGRADGRTASCWARRRRRGRRGAPRGGIEIVGVRDGCEKWNASPGDLLPTSSLHFAANICTMLCPHPKTPVRRSPSSYLTVTLNASNEVNVRVQSWTIAPELIFIPNCRSSNPFLRQTKQRKL